MENPPAPAPANPANNDENAEDAPAPHQRTPANPAGPTMHVPNPQPIPNQPSPQIIHQQVLNWSHFKPEFTDRPEDDVEAHLLHTHDWRVTHSFQEDIKVQRFCLTLVGEARLWYESLTPIAND